MPISHSEKSSLFAKIFSFIFEHQKFGEKIRYLFVGGICAIADLLLLYILVDFFHLWYLFSATISFSLVGLFGYLGQKYFTFKNDSQNHGKQLTLFLAVSGIGLIINIILMYTLVDLMNLWYIFASILTKFVVLIWNFSASKHLTFKN